MSIEKTSFTNLLNDVVYEDRCVGCGTCEAVCPINVVKLENMKPTLTGTCIECGLCYGNCPRTFFDVSEMEKTVHGITRKDEEKLTGIFSEVYAGKAIPKDIQNHAQDGGVVTALLTQFLHDGGEAVIVAGLEEDWVPKPVIATTREAVVDAAGTKYTPSPTLVGVKEAVKGSKLGKIAVVGTPCQITGLTRMTVGDKKNPKYRDAVDLKIGLFCMETFNYDSFMEYLGENDVSASEVTKFEIKKGRFYAYNEDKRLHRARLKKVKKLIRSCCAECKDFANELADISVGNVGTRSGHSTILVRTMRGKKAIDSAINSGLIEVTPIEGFRKGENLVYRLAKMKKSH